MKVWSCGRDIDMNIGQKVFVGHSGSGRSYFGEYGKLARTTKRDLVFITDSGAIVKTSIDNLHIVRGKAREQGYFVSLNIDRDNDPNFYYSPVCIF